MSLNIGSLDAIQQYLKVARLEIDGWMEEIQVDTPVAEEIKI